ncbi:hypothetical protein HOLleu_20477 [Holothuria leucospilota]|uniref:Uncharacterized protein n=1 Tax=Holothuria leucospilota TaxID=206669 RepID=A0A9Q1BZV7_HOLLE|nr:hypothetical protein HOLleu_20477 [Holothuria leucospilota]
MTDKTTFFRFCLLCCLQLLYCCQVETKLHHLKEKGKVKTGECLMENCGPPFYYEIIPNPPSLEKQFTILYGLKLVADVYKAFLHWSVEGPSGIHFGSTTPFCVEHERAEELCPHVAGYYVHGNYTDHVPIFIKPGLLVETVFS